MLGIWTSECLGVDGKLWKEEREDKDGEDGEGLWLGERLDR